MATMYEKLLKSAGYTKLKGSGRTDFFRKFQNDIAHVIEISDGGWVHTQGFRRMPLEQYQQAGGAGNDIKSLATFLAKKV